MAILRHNRDGLKGGCRSQHRANIVRISHLIKHKDRAIIISIVGKNIAKPDIIKRINFCDQPLMWRVPRHHSAKISDIAVSNGKPWRQIKHRERLTRARNLAHVAIGVFKRSDHRVPPPKARPAAAALFCLPALGPDSS
jgi:hypothetical protein